MKQLLCLIWGAIYASAWWAAALLKHTPDEGFVVLPIVLTLPTIFILVAVITKGLEKDK